MLNERSNRVDSSACFWVRPPEQGCPSGQKPAEQKQKDYFFVHLILRQPKWSESNLHDFIAINLSFSTSSLFRSRIPLCLPQGYPHRATCPDSTYAGRLLSARAGLPSADRERSALSKNLALSRKKMKVKRRLKQGRASVYNGQVYLD
jgi:hypothetical protein